LITGEKSNNSQLKISLWDSPNRFMITDSARQNRPSLWGLADLDGRLLFRLGKMGGKQLRDREAIE
jgi:hypothetical protein